MSILRLKKKTHDMENLPDGVNNILEDTIYDQENQSCNSRSYGQQRELGIYLCRRARAKYAGACLFQTRINKQI